jgi:melatonin receptor type 1A
VVSLALADLGMGCFSMHLLLTVLITSEWTFGNSVCQYQGFVSVFMAATSTQTLAWMAVNRFYSVVKPQKYRMYFTRRNTIIITATIWCLSFFAPTPYLVSGKRFLFNPGKFFCYVVVDSGWFTAFLVTVFVAFPSSVIFFCYFRVFQTVQQHNKKLLHSREKTLSVQEIKIARTLVFVIVVVFMICWTPVLIMDFIDTIRGDYSLPREAYATYTFLATLSSSINPIIYGIMNPKFKKEYLRILLCKTIRGVQVETTGVSSTRP